LRFSKLLFFAFAISGAIAQAQEFMPLKNISGYPTDITSIELHDEVYADSLDKITFKKNEKFLKGFQLSSDFFLKNLLFSGKVIYSGPSFELVNRITDDILKGNPVRRNIHVFVLKSTQMNAFTFNNGYIFVNTGLLARINNESQLAFILAHEISHYLLKHVFKAYKKGKESANNKDENEEEENFETMRFSRTQESEADLNGLELIKKTRFNPVESIVAIDLLKNFKNPIENANIYKLLAGAGCFQIPVSLLNDSAFGFIYNENEDDILMSHPNLGSRKKSLSEAMTISNLNYKDEFTSLFNEVKGSCMAEQVHLYMLEKDYIRAFYNSLILVNKYPSSSYFRKSLIQSGYFLIRCNNTIGATNIIGKITKEEGEIYRLAQLLRKLTKEEFNVLITGICLRNESSRIPQLALYNNEIIAELQATTGKNSSYFQTYTVEIDSLIKSQYSSSEVQNDKHVRYTGEKLIRKKKERTIVSFAPYFLCDLASVPAFVSRYDSIFKRNELLTTSQAEEQISDAKEITNTSKSKPKKRDFDKLIFLDAQHIFIDNRGKEPVKFIASETKKKAMIQKFMRFAKESNTYVVVMNPENINQYDPQLINDRSTLITWIEEANSTKRINPKFFTDNQELESIMNRTGVRYVSTYTSGTIIQKKKQSEAFSFIIALLYPPYLIPTIYNALHVNKNYLYQFVIYDVKTGEVVYQKNETLNTADRDDVLNAELYNLFYQLHKK